MENRAAYNKTTEQQASRRLPPFFLRFFPAGSRRPGPSRENAPAYRESREPEASRWLPPFFLRLFPDGSRRHGPARENVSAYKETPEPEASRRLPPFFSRFFPAGSRRPGPPRGNASAYSKSREPQAKAARCCPLGCTLRHLWGWRLPVKVVQTIFSFVAVVCEEIVDYCITCSGLYLFEFTSCSAFLLSLLILYVYCTNLYESLGEDKVQKLVFGFFASFAFAAEFGIEFYLKRKQNADGRPENPGNTPSATENQPLNKRS
ncbi:hypothetical protein DV515_00001684 [Chloebia gouldiae]|uniref:MARVEL domain-containing protein n=1 Tax=Chloebia gouldiae TaxID=44316 RepID=A0A3L8SYZ6_CHLGU|nr:hypothetical protein DV515_00001684 [Chloebia gouldiae]